MKRGVHTLVESYLERAATTIPGELPVVPRSKTVVPVVVTNEWVVTKSAMRKRYRFIDNELRNSFLEDAFDLEMTTGHIAKLTLDDMTVDVELTTRDLELVTQVDREHARELDRIYRDVCYGKQ